MVLHNSGKSRREIVKLCLPAVIAIEAKQSISSRKEGWIASSLSLLAMTALAV
jgi:hypothetical protein